MSVVLNGFRHQGPKVASTKRSLMREAGNIFLIFSFIHCWYFMFLTLLKRKGGDLICFCHTFRMRTCSAFTEHVSYLYWKFILVPSDSFSACSTGLFWCKETFRRPVLHPQVLSYRFSSLPIFPLTLFVQLYQKFSFAPLQQWLLFRYLSLAFLQNAISGSTVLQKANILLPVTLF